MNRLIHLTCIACFSDGVYLKLIEVCVYECECNREPWMFKAIVGL